MEMLILDFFAFAAPRRANLPDAMIKLNAGTHLRQNKLFGKGPGECNGYRI